MAPLNLKRPKVSRAQLISLAVVFLWCFIGGIAHIVAMETELRIVAPYIP